MADPVCPDALKPKALKPKAQALCPAACLAEHLDDEELRKLADHIFAQLRRPGLKPDTACIYIQLTGSVRCAEG